MAEDYKCPKCGGKPRYISGTTKEFIFFCLNCQEEFTVEDKGFGYWSTREKILKERFP